MVKRKPHVQVEQHYYLDYICEYGPQTMCDLAMIFDVSEATAKRKLDGLVAQGKLLYSEIGGGWPRGHGMYLMPGADYAI